MNLTSKHLFKIWYGGKLLIRVKFISYRSIRAGRRNIDIVPEDVGRVIFAFDLCEAIVVVSVEPLGMGLALPVEGSSADITPLQILDDGSPLLLHPFDQLGLINRFLPPSPGYSHQSCLVVAGPGS